MTRLSPGTLILAIFAVLFGLVGAYTARQYLREEPPQAEAEVEVERPQIVPLAAVDITPGRTLTLGDIIVSRMTDEQIRDRELPMPFMSDPSQIIGRTLRTAVAKGEAFAPAMLYPEGIGPSIAERLALGYRAITIPLGNSAAEMALASPGMTVDIVFRTTPNDVKQVPEATVTLLECVEVLAIGEEMFIGARATGAGSLQNSATATVTLAVKPKQASALKVVEGHGTMSLVVRGPEDDMLVDNGPPQTLAGLLDLPRPAAPFTTQIYRRGLLTTSVFEGGQQTEALTNVVGLPVAAADSPRVPVRPVSRTAAQDAKAKKPTDCGCNESKK